MPCGLCICIEWEKIEIFLKKKQFRWNATSSKFPEQVGISMSGLNQAELPQVFLSVSSFPRYTFCSSSSWFRGNSNNHRLGPVCSLKFFSDVTDFPRSNDVEFLWEGLQNAQITYSDVFSFNLQATHESWKGVLMCSEIKLFWQLLASHRETVFLRLVCCLFNRCGSRSGGVPLKW